ncbi:AMP-binding protein [Saccharothrix sp. BKS2]|uniref:AMP-binding protein n=1 Tax=Saccharothrix sp. BKS2 TaxID=3064400 RepID=UPI0039EAB3D8
MNPTDIAAELTALWEQALGVDGIAEDENFVDLGGDSITATRIAAGIRDRLGLTVGLRVIFDHPTVGELAEELAAEELEAEPAAPAYAGLWGGESDAEWLPLALRRTAGERRDDLALVGDGPALTYAGLYAWAHRTAELLRERGVRPGDRVAVAYPRGTRAVVALLGVLLAEATYVPLDPEYPVRRLEHMVTDSAPALLLTDRDVVRHPVTATVPDAPEPDAAGLDAAGFDPETDVRWPREQVPERAVYLIYTSGSTGWPKGVEVSYHCIDAMARWQADHSIAPDLRTAQFAPLNFDVQFQEVLGTLVGGGTVAVVPERLRREPGELLEWLAEHGVQRVFLPNLALQMLTIAATDELLARLRLVEVNTAGEQLVCTPRIRRFFERLPGCRLNNHYGQSESAMVTAHVLTGPPADWPALPPIGTPLPGCEALVLPDDPAVPTVGELLVAGRPMSAGYLGQPELTARRYVDVPRTPHGHTRAFRTGDKVELVDGVLRFLTRNDDEVKLRGIRVDPLEVDAHLLAEPGVDGAVTVVVESASGHRTLRSAVVLAGGGTGLDTDAVTARLREVLPEVAVPVSITVLDAFPRTPSGKVDRVALAGLLAEAVRARRHRAAVRS